MPVLQQFRSSEWRCQQCCHDASLCSHLGVLGLTLSSLELTTALALQAVYAELLRQCFNTYKVVRGNAVSAVMATCKRFPCLAPVGLVVAVRAVAKLPQLPEASMQEWLCRRRRLP